MAASRLKEQADGSSNGHARSWKSMLKRAKNRAERRKAKQKPDCFPTYGKYWGYQL